MTQCSKFIFRPSSTAHVYGHVMTHIRRRRPRPGCCNMWFGVCSYPVSSDHPSVHDQHFDFQARRRSRGDADTATVVSTVITLMCHWVTDSHLRFDAADANRLCHKSCSSAGSFKPELQATRMQPLTACACTACSQAAVSRACQRPAHSRRRLVRMTKHCRPRVPAVPQLPPERIVYGRCS